MTNVYIDQDGVVADFDKGLLKHGLVNNKTFMHLPHHEWTDEQRKLFKEVGKVMSTPGFFQTLPMMPHAKELWLTAGNRRFILTARPTDGEEGKRIEREKKAWLDQNFGNVPDYRFICCLRSEKKKYAKGNILVDDMEINCKEWTDNGGVAILFETPQQAIKDLKRLV